VSVLPAQLPVPLRPDAQVCGNSRCATLLAADAELCDECGGSRLEPLAAATTLLCGWAAERPVTFRLATGRPEVIGRAATSGAAPDIDLSRFPASQQVHRRHAQLEARADGWRLTHLGTNPLLVEGSHRGVVQPGGSTLVRPGDTLNVAGVRLQLVAPRGREAR
jgi:hypothetical protein